jgi:hypothetical protein
MTDIPITDFVAADQPESFAVRVLMRPGRLHPQPWMPRTLEVIGVVADSDQASSDGVTHSAAGEDGIQIYRGLRVRLHLDEAESYYHNLTVERPRCFVVTREDETGEQAPFLATLSYDEANAYLEGDDQVHAVDLAPELYRWVEAYVLSHYLPAQRKKRKRTEWKNS